MDTDKAEAGDSDYRVTYNEDYNDGDKLRERMDKQFSEVRRRLTDVLKVLQWALVTIAVLVTVIICLLAVILVNTEDNSVNGHQDEGSGNIITTTPSPQVPNTSNSSVLAWLTPPPLFIPSCPVAHPPWNLTIARPDENGEHFEVPGGVLCKDDCEKICMVMEETLPVPDCKNLLLAMDICVDFSSTNDSIVKLRQFLLNE